MTTRDGVHEQEATAGREAPPLVLSVGRLRVDPLDLAIVVALTAAAAFMRFWQLDSVPLGLHGDEAWTGLDARRVLDEGWIGPYLRSALGQPIGPVYFTALLFTFLPETTFTIRFSMAVFGVLSIPLAYATFALMFNRTAGAFAAVFLATMMWHLHLGRTGYMVTTWPFIELAVLCALWLAIQRRNVWLFVVAGALAGAGVYTYNAYLLFLPVPLFALLWTLVAARTRPDRIRAAAFSVAFAAAAVIVALPMIFYAAGNWEIYREHQRVVGVTNQQRWDDASVAGKADILWDRATEWHNALIFGDRPDLGDGMAHGEYAPLHVGVYALAIGGIFIALVRVRRLEYALCLVAMLVLPLGAILTIGDGLFRRTLGITPFVAALAALPLAELWRILTEKRGAVSTAGIAMVLFVPALVAMTTTYQYFGPMQDTATMRLVYPYQVDAAAHWIDDLPDGTYVYFYSDRWSFRYETVRFIAPGATGEDRSLEFRTQGRLGPVSTAITVPPSRPVAFVLLGAYTPMIDEIAALYEDGERHEGRRDGETTFIAWFLPPRN